MNLETSKDNVSYWIAIHKSCGNNHYFHPCQSVKSQQVIHWHTRFGVISSHQYQIGCRIRLQNKSPISGFEPMTFIMVSCTLYHLKHLLYNKFCIFKDLQWTSFPAWDTPVFARPHTRQKGSTTVISVKQVGISTHQIWYWNLWNCFSIQLDFI